MKCTKHMFSNTYIFIQIHVCIYEWLSFLLWALEYKCEFVLFSFQDFCLFITFIEYVYVCIYCIISFFYVVVFYSCVVERVVFIFLHFLEMFLIKFYLTCAQSLYWLSSLSASKVIAKCVFIIFVFFFCTIQSMSTRGQCENIL